MPEKRVVEKKTSVKTEVKMNPDGTKVTTITTTTVSKYSDGTTGTEVTTQTEKQSAGQSTSTAQKVVHGHASTVLRESKPDEAQINYPLKTDEKFLQQALKAHNDLRAKHSSPPLELDKALCSSSQQWADKIAAKHKMQHSDTNHGENVYWSTKSALEGNVPVESWYSEIKDFNFNKMEPQKGTGHFTQLIWKDTERVGIAFTVDSKGDTYVVAQYYPAGNFIGHYAENISKPK